MSDSDGTAKTTTMSAPQLLNTNNLVVASFAALLILLLLAFFLGILYICAKLRRGKQQSAVGLEVGDTGWVHNSFNRGTSGKGAPSSPAAGTAAMYTYDGDNVSGWPNDRGDSIQRQDEAQNALARNRPAFYGRNDIASSRLTRQQTPMDSSLVRAALPNIAERHLPPSQQQQRCVSVDDQAYDQLRMQRLALSGPFANENAVSSDSVADPRLANLGDGTDYLSEEYLDVLGVKN